MILARENSENIMDSVRFKCIACHCELGSTVPLNDGYSGYKCASCGLIKTILKDDDSVEGNNIKQYSNIINRLRMYFRREREFSKRFGYICKNIRIESRTLRIAEVGSNLGYFSNYLNKLGHDVTSIEVNDSLCRAQSLLFDIDSVKKISDLPDASFDLIIFLDVIEHIPEIDKIMQMVSEKLKVKGRLYLQFPNNESAISKLRGVKWSWLSCPDHVYHFSSKAARALMNNFNYEIERDFKFSPVLDDLSDIPIVKKLLRPFWLINIFMPLNSLIKWPGGSLIGIVGVKKL